MSEEKAEYGLPKKIEKPKAFTGSPDPGMAGAGKEAPPVAWEQQEGESNLWYDRFFRFCLVGSSRSLDQCYRDIAGEERAAKGREGPREDARIPGSWKKKVKEFDWWGRAEAWDAEQRVQAVKRVADALDLARFHAQEAVHFQINLMRGVTKNKEGQETTVNDVQQRRLASNSLLNRAGVVYDGPEVDDEDGAVQVIGIRVQKGEFD